MVGLPGFRVLEVYESAGELDIETETDACLVGCPRCGVVVRTHDRALFEYRDLAAFGRPARLRWHKRRFRCEESMSCARWSEESPWFSSRCPLTNHAGAECCRQLGRRARPVTQRAHELGVCWDTVMDASASSASP